jgi:hypothetical protein
MRQAVPRMTAHAANLKQRLPRGLEVLPATDVPPGKPVSLTPEVLASLEQALHWPAGVASHEVLRQWVRRTRWVAVKDKTRSKIVRTRFQAKVKVPSPSPPKNPDAIAEF